MNYTVLLVDAERNSRLQLRSQLAQQRPGWHFLEAGSDDEAIDHSIREPIQLVSIHCATGNDLARKLHALLPHSTLIQWFDQGADTPSSLPQLHYLATPIDEAAIRQLLQLSAPALQH
ncbi:hypothetical protein HZU75_03930 [Chitinibacter fontanus]|uniref:Response regulatory domain-containing protein n=1 Tax=Chitinibacter fontanus TaxID=1737446 RepID=A0A7D5ZE33_9NEIS|nr:hypothetical protein [Chitinibacter fontanus]QLI80748.1 hypothetical protein HZU75_03930 [Chitinibacter fontanus]